MTKQVFDYLAVNWIPLATGALITAVVVPTIKWAGTHALGGVSLAGRRLLDKARRWIKDARLARRLRRARSGEYVGRLSMGDFRRLLDDTAIDRLHPTYQAEWKAVVQTMEGVAKSVAAVAQQLGRPSGR